MNESFAHTFYAAAAKPGPERPPLRQEIEADVCIVGGGFAGLWAARALAARGQDVVLLEADRVAGGASGQNGGFVSAGFAARLSNIVARVGLDHARELYALSRKGVEIVQAAIAADRALVQAQPGRLHVLRYNDEPGLSDYRDRLARDFGHALELWPKERVRDVLVTDRYYQALFEPDAFHLNPLLLARLLASEAEDRGVRIFEQSRVTGADLDGLRKSVMTADGRVRCFHVVLAGSAALGDAFPWISETVLPVRTHVAVTAPLGEPLHQAIRFRGAIADTRRAGDYYHVMGDRLLWGGRISARRNPPRKLERLMARDIARVYPQLAGAPLEHVWSGVMGYAVHLMPQIGMAQPGVWVSSAFGGHGLNTTAIAGELIASAITEQDDRWRLFVPFGLVWNGGAAGRAVTQAVYWTMGLKDWLDETQTRAVERDEEAVKAGLAPGLLAHVYRREKRRFVESRIGGASIRVARVLQRAAIAGAQPFIHAGRVLVPAIWAVTGAIGFVARIIGRGMEIAADGIKAALRVIAGAAVSLWRRAIVPAAGRAWTGVLKPASLRFAEGTRSVSAWGVKRSSLMWSETLVPAAQRAGDRVLSVAQRAAEAREPDTDQLAENRGGEDRTEENKAREEKTGEDKPGEGGPPAGKKKKKKSKDKSQKIEA